MRNRLIWLWQPGLLDSIYYLRRPIAKCGADGVSDRGVCAVWDLTRDAPGTI